MWILLLSFIIGLGTVSWASWHVRQRERYWTKSLDDVLDLLPRVQAGEAPVEQLTEIQGGLTPLLPAIQNVFHELRCQRTAVAELEAEIRQKVANRTDALERTIGSLRLQAMRDPLTTLFNRRFLDQYLPQCIQRHTREHKDLCLLMIDVDHFKILNDTLGHAAGDELLKAIGQLIRSAVRGQDIGIRLGGDEFVVLLPDSSVDAGASLASRLTSMVDGLGKPLRVPKSPRLSVGIMTLGACESRTAEGLLEAADRALYDVKRTRRSARASLNAEGTEVQSPPLSRKAG